MAQKSKQTSQLSFSNTFSDTNLKVFEVTEDILKDLLSNACIKGQASDKAVLCTKTHSYTIKQLDSSNTMLFLPKDDQIVHGQSFGYFELQPVESPLPLVQTLLKDSLFTDDDENDSKTLYRLETLREQVQVSDGELKDVLYKLGVFEDKKQHLRMMSAELRMEVMNMILASMKARGWAVDERIQLSSLCQEVSVYPSEQVKACARMYSRDNRIETQIALDPSKVAIFKAEQILRNAPKNSMRWSELKSEWEKEMREEEEVLKKHKVDLTLDLLRDCVVSSDGNVLLSI